MSLIMLDSVIRVNKKYYRQTLLEECKYAIKKNKLENPINHDLTLRSSDNSDHESDDSYNESDDSNNVNESVNESVNETVNESDK